MDAVGLLGQAQSAEFNNPVLHYYLANALSKINQKNDAIREYKVALALQPEGQLADYCQKALSSLTSPKGGANSKGGVNPLAPKTVLGLTNGQQPQIMAIVCGCPLCHSLEISLADLQTKFGDKVAFRKLQQTSTDPKDMDILMRYAVLACPTVLFFDAQGQLVNRVSGQIPDTDIYKNTQALATASPRTLSKDEQRLTQQRSQINADAQARINDDQRRVDNEISMIQNQLAIDIANLPRYSGNIATQLRADADKRITQLKADLERRKKEYSGAADARVGALSPSNPGGSGRLTPETISPTVRTYDH